MWIFFFITVIFLFLYLKRSTSKGKKNEDQHFSGVQVVYDSGPSPPPVQKEYDCPHCGKFIENPGRKRKKICPNCSKEYVHIYLPEKNLKKLFTPDEGNIYLKQQAIERQKERNKRWQELNRKLSIHAGRNEWGKYSFCHWEMAEILQVEGRSKEALRHLLSKCYLDLNGPCDLGGYSLKCAKEEMDMVPFDLKQKLIPPATIRLAVELIEKLKLSEEEVQKMFFGVHEKSLKLIPRSMDDCWQELRAILFDD